ncbi:MAG: hypothetical protein DLM54_12435 [Acidimicrobiales bacterium]|nr:MAG: hypothetical protein DLM54_12435 [Acidimicrobiales bacterium]
MITNAKERLFMPDICDRSLDDHETLRRRFAELDQQRDAGPEALARMWDPLATGLGQPTRSRPARRHEDGRPRLLPAPRSRLGKSL